MTDLITRLSKLDAPDREVDVEIFIRFNIPAERAGRIDYAHGMVGWWPKDGPYVSAVTVPAYTASVDAVIALAERVLPKYGRFVRSDMHGHHAGVFTPYTMSVTEGSGATPAITLCIALLRAKEASNAE